MLNHVEQMNSIEKYQANSERSTPNVGFRYVENFNKKQRHNAKKREALTRAFYLWISFIGSTEFGSHSCSRNEKNFELEHV